jgi:hypothetical protein
MGTIGVAQSLVGTLKMTPSFQTNLILKDDAKPVFTKARSLPYATRPKVEKELDRLEQEGVIFKVPTSDWVTPIVPIVKQSGDVAVNKLVLGRFS